MTTLPPERILVKSHLSNLSLGNIESMILTKPAIGFQLVKSSEALINHKSIDYAVTLFFDTTLSINIEYSFEAISITTIINPFEPLRISVFEFITEAEILALEEMLNKDLKDNNIIIQGGVKLDVPEDEVSAMIRIAIDRFETK